MTEPRRAVVRRRPWTGHPTEHVLRQTYIALHLAERLAMDEQEREVVYYASMLAWLGCHIDAYEQAKWFGDDQAFKHDAAYVDIGDAVGSPPSCCDTSVMVGHSLSASKPASGFSPTGDTTLIRCI